MPNVKELEQAFRVYFDEIEQCKASGTRWALLHVVFSLPDICGALESESGWATAPKYVEWCRGYLPAGLPTPEDYRDLRDRVLHQGRTLTASGRYYKFVRPSPGTSVHRHTYSDVIVLVVDDLAAEMVAGIKTWFRTLQEPGAAGRRANVANNLRSLVVVTEQELPGAGGIIVSATHTATGTS
jgi:hypothetical protein